MKAQNQTASEPASLVGPKETKAEFVKEACAFFQGCYAAARDNKEITGHSNEVMNYCYKLLKPELERMNARQEKVLTAEDDIRIWRSDGENFPYLGCLGGGGPRSGYIRLFE